jgi:ribose-phosphate pyrophosphokinase
MINLKVNGGKVEFKSWKFPAGEVGVQIPHIAKHEKVWIELIMPTSDEIFIALNILDALAVKDIPRENIDLFIPYMPYGRQDRVCNEGESFALRVFGHMLKAFPHYNNIYIKDMHSEVTHHVLMAYGMQVQHMSQSSCAKYLPKFDALIAPDKGAAEKVMTHYQVGLGTPYFTLNKVRLDGRVIYEDYPHDTIKGNVCVVDDICDGGATFLSLATMLNRSQPNITALNLYVTHGIFSKGVEELLKMYDTIYVHNNMNPDVEVKTNRVEVI